MNWNAKSRDLKGATVFTLQAMLYTYVVIAVGAVFSGNVVSPPQSMAGFASVISGMAIAGVRYLALSHRNAMSR